MLFCGFAMMIGVWWYLTDAIQWETCFYVCWGLKVCVFLKCKYYHVITDVMGVGGGWVFRR